MNVNIVMDNGNSYNVDDVKEVDVDYIDPMDRWLIVRKIIKGEKRCGVNEYYPDKTVAYQYALDQ